MKLPVFDKLQRFDKRILAWDGPPIECPTKDKLYIIVDCFARWRISDPMLYYNRLNDERSALSRLDDILGSETRTAVATHDLVEIIRVTKGRKPVRDEDLEKTGTVLPTTIPDIEYGRGEIEKQITERTRQKIADFGIELLDERFKRSKYNPAVAEKIIERMQGSVCGGEGRPSRVSSMVAALFLLLAASTLGSTGDFANRILSVEKRSGARIGVAALDTASGKRLDYRSEERFPMCSTFKFLAAAAVLKRVDDGKEKLDRFITYGAKDILEHGILEPRIHSVVRQNRSWLCQDER